MIMAPRVWYRWGEVLSACGWRAAGESRVRVGDAASHLASLPTTIRELNQCYNNVFLTYVLHK